MNTPTPEQIEAALRYAEAKTPEIARSINMESMGKWPDAGDNATDILAAAYREQQREIAEMRQQRDSLAESLRKCENYLKPHGLMVADEEPDESGWILLCEVRSALATLKGEA